VPGIRIQQWSAQFAAAGWHVVEVKYGRRLQAKFAEPHGEALRSWIDAMPNEQYQSLFALSGPALRERFLDGAPEEAALSVADVSDDDLAPLVQDLGGHDIAALLEAFAECDKVTDRPSVLFAYTVKGWGLPIAGNPRNHSALLTGDQIDALRSAVGLTHDTEWDRLDPTSAAGIHTAARREHLTRDSVTEGLEITVPHDTGLRPSRPTSTQEAFGRVLVDLSRNEEVAPYLVTTAPDVATSTNLAGFINRAGVFSPVERRAWNEDPVLKWAEGPSGQHIELGISEMNLFLLLGQLGLSWDLSAQPLIPVGTVYDPFVLRGLDAFIYGTYSGARFIVAGTPSGVTLAPEGGAHQSTMTPSVGLELPGVTLIEPAYATALDWLLCDAVGHVAAGPTATRTAAPYEEGAYYLRLTTRPIDQAPFEAARARLGDAVLRRQVLAGAYRLVDAFEAHPELAAQDGVPVPTVNLVATGAVLPEVLEAADELAEEGVAAHVVDVTSLDRLYSAWQRTLRQAVRTATTPSVPGALRAAFPDAVPIVTVHDAASHAMAWLGSALGVPSVPLGVDAFGQSGTVHELYELHDLLPGSIVNAALAALSLRR
jgi:pyruvate dehydrogenase E1 component